MAKKLEAYRTIGEVSKLLNLEKHILRSWEDSLSQVKPLKRKGGRRLYSESDINIIRKIKNLIYIDGYTIKGVKKFLSKNKLSEIKSEDNLEISIEAKVRLQEIVSKLKNVRFFHNEDT